jgi:hypothetical protein
MILDTEVEVVINNQTIQHYVNKGYNAVYRTPIKVNPYDLTPGSRVVVNIQCDVCYTTYIYAFREVKIGNGGEYICKKCKIRKTRKYLPGVKEGMIEKCKNIIPNKLKNNPNYINEVVEKSKKTKSKRYGDPTYNNQNKKKQTCFEKYGVEHYFDINKKKQTSLKRYGDPTYNNQNKKKQTCFEKYGVEHSSQVDEIFIKYQKSAHVLKRFENTELNYRGSYEYDFLLYCKNNNIIVENARSIPYEYDGRLRKYFPDFYHRDTNTVIEIKSSYTLNKNYEKNMAKKDAVIKNKFNFIFIIDKNYDVLVELVKKYCNE